MFYFKKLHFKILVHRCNINFSEVLFFFSAAPHWIEEPADVEANIGDDVVFKCVANAVPEPAYKWSFNGIPLQGTFCIYQF